MTAGSSTAPLRISILCGGHSVFGLEVMALTAARELRDRGHQVFVVANAWNDGEFGRRLTAIKIPFETMYFGKISKSLRPRALSWTANALWHLPGARRRLKKHFNQFAPNVVIVHNRDFALLANSMLRGRPTIFHVHELPLPSKATKWIYKTLDASTVAMIAVSRYIASRLEAFGVNERKIVVIHNGANAPPDDQPEIRHDRIPTIGVVGQIGEWKGHDDLIEALALLRKAGHNFRCAIFGRGDPQYTEALQRKARDLGISDAIDWQGYVANPAAIYSQIDISVVPSRFEDPCPVVAIEASLHGKPIVATSRGGLPELIVDGVTGFLVDAQSPRQLADRMSTLLADRELVGRMGEAGRRHAMAEFTATHMVDRIEALCRSVATRDPISKIAV
jgi:glycosyltransferase involved in cell wall biosynthesis